MKVICITNIPTPYRLDLFRTTYQLFQKKRLDYKVWFMAGSEPTRNWSFTEQDFLFPSKIWSGFHPRQGLASYHFNPKLLIQLCKERPNILIIGGAWIFPTSIAALILAKCFFKKTKIYFWSETHADKGRKEHILLKKLKQLLFSWYDGFLVPGKRAKDYIQQYVKKGDMDMISFPNTVNRKRYEELVNYYRETEREGIREKYGIDKEESLLILPARLIAVKGIIPFLQALQKQDPSHYQNNFQILIAGDGELFQKIKDEIKPSYKKRIHLIGYLEELELIKIYAAADIFLLPSLHDANPLSVIEALWSELPLLLSTGVGNYPEALVEGKNGWLFDMSDEQTIQQSMISALRSRKEELQEFGRYSRYIAYKNFQKELIVQHLAEQLTASVHKNSST